MNPTDVMQLAEEGNATELRADMRRRALTSLYYFTKVVCGYNQLVQHFHMPLCNDIQNTIHIRKRGYLWPRGHFKSTIIAKSYPHWRLLGGGQLETLPELLDLDTQALLRFYAMYPERDPRNLRFGIVGESADVAEKDLKDIKDRTLNNEVFRWLFPEIIPEDIRATKWTESEVLLPRTRSFDESSITCMGVGAKKTGFHYDGLVYDDPIGEAASHSEAIMLDALNWMKAAPGMLNDPVNGEELIAGTRWKDGTADVYGWFMKNLPYIPATESVPAEGFRFSTLSCFYEPTREVRFKERFTEAALNEILKRQGPYLFNCNYRNTPTPQEGSKLAGFKYYEVVSDPEGLMRVAQPLDGTPPVHINQLARVSFYDPSSGGKRAQCEGAIVIVGTDCDNRHFVIEAWSANMGYSGTIEHWHNLNDRYRCWCNCYEQVGAQKEIGDIVLQRTLHGGKCVFCGGTHKPLCPQARKPPSGVSKEERVELWLEPAIREGRLYLRKEHAELIRQLEMFPNGDLVDQADALSGAVHNSRPYMGVEEMMADKQEQEIRAAARTAMTAGASRAYGGYA